MSPIENKKNITMFMSPSICSIRYYTTYIVRFDNDKVKLDSNGHRTASTKRHMNNASIQYNLGFKVFQKDFEWFVRLPRGDIVDFQDNMAFRRY